jgi:hypothetical protein
MKPKQILAAVGVGLAVLTFWASIPIAVPVIIIGAAIIVD